MVTHKSIIHGRCPINGRWDYYDVIIATSEFIAVESIETALDDLRGSAFTQEAICEKLKAILPASCKVTLSGRHSQNTQTTVEL